MNDLLFRRGSAASLVLKIDAPRPGAPPACLLARGIWTGPLSLDAVGAALREMTPSQEFQIPPHPASATSVGGL